jgi:hypothetical protein
MKFYYKVLQIGASGGGKTFSFRNLGKETGYINVENKPLPFPDKFGKHIAIQDRNPTAALSALIELAKDPTIEVIVFDSFSEYMDMVLAEARKTKKGFDIWSSYSEEIAKFHTILKKIQKTVFVTGHYEILNIEGAPEKRLKVSGKEHEGQVEKHYTMVLYADKTWSDAKQNFKYEYQLAGENISAKCPPQIFGEDVLRIPNDSDFINKQINEFTKLND